MTNQATREKLPPNYANLARTESLTEPMVRAVEVSLGATMGITLLLCSGWLAWASLLALGPLWRGLHAPCLHVGLDGIVHRGTITTSYQPFELLHDADVQRIGDSKCRIVIGPSQSQWAKPFGIDETERVRIRDWLRSAIMVAREGMLSSVRLATNLDEIAHADDATLLKAATGFGTSISVRVVAISNLVLRGSSQLAESYRITDHILSADSRRLIKRAFKVASQEDLLELRRCLPSARLTREHQSNASVLR